MVLVCALLGTVAMGMMFDPAEVNANFNSYVANGAYWAFQRLGNYYGVGNLLMVIYAVCNAIGQFFTLVVPIDAPLRMLLGDENARQFVPKDLLKQNDKGPYINGIKMVVVLCGSIILAQIVVPGAAAVLTQLNKLNSVCMPLRYLWVFVAYFMLKRDGAFDAEYKFVKGKTLGMVLGGWCFLVTLACCVLGMYSTDPFTMVLNVVTPLVLVALGFILPEIRKRQDAKELEEA